MNWKKSIIVVLLPAIAADAVPLAPEISDGINYFFLQPVFQEHVSSFFLNYFTHALAACFCAFLIWKFAIRKWVIFPLLLVMVVTTVLMNIDLFYQYQQMSPKILT